MKYYGKFNNPKDLITVEKGEEIVGKQIEEALDDGGAIRAELDAKADLVNGKVPSGQLPEMDYIPTSEKGTAGGVASLGSDGKVPEEQLPPISADKPESFDITLTVAGWSNGSQTVLDEKFVVDNYDYLVSPAPASVEDYMNAVIYANNVTVDGSLTFNCTTTPDNAISVHILKVGVE